MTGDRRMTSISSSIDGSDITLEMTFGPGVIQVLYRLYNI